MDITLDFSALPFTPANLPGVTFYLRRLSVREARAIQRVQNDAEGQDSIERVVGLAQLILCGWEGLADVDGKQVPFLTEEKQIAGLPARKVVRQDLIEQFPFELLLDMAKCIRNASMLGVEGKGD